MDAKDAIMAIIDALGDGGYPTTTDVCIYDVEEDLEYAISSITLDAGKVRITISNDG